MLAPATHNETAAASDLNAQACDGFGRPRGVIRMAEQYLYCFSATGLMQLSAWLDGLAASEDRFYEFIEYDPLLNEGVGVEPPYSIDRFREVIESPYDTGPGSSFASGFAPYLWKALDRFANDREHFEVLMYQVLLQDTWRVGFPDLLLAGSKTKKKFLQRECRRLAEDLREEAWLVRKLCYGYPLDEISKDETFPVWLFKCHDSFLGCLTSDEALSLKSSGFRYCNFVKAIYEKAEGLDAGTSELIVGSIEELKEAIRRTSRSGGGMLFGYSI
jgi:hypothetical protein